MFWVIGDVACAHAPLRIQPTRSISGISRLLPPRLLADIDLENKRAELLIGFPDLPVMRQRMVESALLLFVAAFACLNLRKLVNYVYQDNLPAQEAALHFGFQREGVLRSHVCHRQSGKRVDLHVFGLLREDFFESSYLRRIGRRAVTPNYPIGCLRLNFLPPLY